MAPATRLMSTKVTSTTKYSSISSKNSTTSKDVMYSKLKADHSPSKLATLKNSIVGKNASYSKRKAENSPPKPANLKRAALNDLTNNNNIRFKAPTQLKKRSVVSTLQKADNQLNKGIRVTRSSTSILKEVKNTTHTVGVGCEQSKNDVKVTRRPTTNALRDACEQVGKNVRFTRRSTANTLGNACEQVEKNVRVTRRSTTTTFVDACEKVEKNVRVTRRSTTTTFEDACEQVEKDIRVTRRSTRLKEDAMQKVQITANTFQEAGTEAEEEVKPLRRSSARLSQITANAFQEAGTETEEEVKPSRRSSVRLSQITTNAFQEAGTETEEEVKPSRRSSARLSQITANAFQEAGTETEEEVKPSRRSSARLSMSRKSLTADKSIESNSLYVSALEDVLNATKDQDKGIKKRTSIVNELSEFDKELLHDPHQVSLYAMEIFQYLKSRELHFAISDYMPKHRHNISEDMRAVLIDWMVEVQENFELNHETLYLAVKLVDMYLDKVDKIEKEVLQLVGVTTLFLSCKYDERLSPLLEDFVYVCDGAYKQQDILVMEQNLLKSINYELSVPISYSFLRRYARCARVQMPLLTLARYILELSLMDYRTVTLSDSKQAAASLYLAFRMIDHDNWTESLVFYTGYKLDEFRDIVFLFNGIVHKPPNKKLMAVRTKYSHELFFNVAKLPLISDEELKKNIDLHS